MGAVTTRVGVGIPRVDIRRSRVAARVTGMRSRGTDLLSGRPRLPGIHQAGRGVPCGPVTGPEERGPKVYQLSGNVREDARCPACHPGYQREIYTNQLLEVVYNVTGSIDRHTNWCENAAVREPLLTLVDHAHLFRKESVGTRARAGHEYSVVRYLPFRQTRGGP